MELNRKDFLETLKRLSPAITQKEVISQSTDFIFSGEKIITYNGDLCISANFESEFTGAINGKTLFNFLSSLKEDMFEIIKKENNFILKSGKIKSKIKSKDIDSEYVKYDVDAFKDISDDLFKAIKTSIFSIAKDESIFPLNCVSVDNDTVITCDNIRATKINIHKTGSSFLIPFGIAKILIQYKDFTSFYVEDKWCHLKTDNDIVYSFHMVFGEYPDVEFLFNPEEDGIIFTFPEELKEAIEPAMVFSDEVLEITARENVIKCMSTGNNGTVYASIDHEIHQELHFNINPLFLKEILSHTNECVIYDNTLLFETDSFIHVLAKVVD